MDFQSLVGDFVGDGDVVVVLHATDRNYYNKYLRRKNTNPFLVK